MSASSAVARIKEQLIGTEGRIVGRDNEQKQLNEAFDRAMAECKPHLVLLSGEAGTGKTALGNSLRPVALKEKILFVSGKFEEFTLKEPYEAFVTALSSYTHQLVESRSEVALKAIKHDALKAAGSDGGLLIDIVPSFSLLLGNSVIAPTKSPNYGYDTQNKLRYLLCNFIHALCSHASMVLLLDNLQWADTASCELIRSLLYMDDVPLLLIGTQQVGRQLLNLQPFVTICKELEHDISCSYIHKIKLTNLDLNAVTTVVSDLFGRTFDDARTLSQLVMHQTNGNVFHVMRHIRLLVEKDIVRTDDTGKWVWDIDLSSREECSQTILDLIKLAILQLPRSVQEMLKAASCLGDDIDDSALDLIMLTKSALYLQTATDEGLLVFSPQSGGYSFAHDWVRECAFSLIPEDEQNEFRLKLGRKLWTCSSALAKQRNVFQVVSLLNYGVNIIEDEVERCRVAALNLRAGERAIAVAAFPYAATFLKAGIQLLPKEKCWREYYDLSLSLYSALVEVDNASGNYDDVVTNIQEVITNGRSMKDKLRVYSVLVIAMTHAGNLEEAMSVAVDVLKQLGEVLPTAPSHKDMQPELFKTKRWLRSKGSSNLLNMPPNQEPSKIAILDFLIILCSCATRARSPYAPIAACRSVQATLRYGLHETSAVGLMQYSACLSSWASDYESATEYGRLAIVLAETMEANRFVGAVFTGFGSFVSHWTGSFNEAISHIRHGFSKSSEWGDIDTVLLSKVAECQYMLLTGEHLPTLLKEVKIGIRLCRLYRRRSSEVLFLILAQLCECYMGLAPDNTRLTGSFMNFEEILRDGIVTKNGTTLLVLYLVSLELGYIFDDYEYAEEIREKLDLVQHYVGGFAIHVLGAQLRGMVAVAMARKGIAETKNMQLARSAVKRLNNWGKLSSQSLAEPKGLLLEAEMMSLKKSKAGSRLGVSGVRVDGLYMKAIDSAKRRGFASDVAGAYERLADYQHRVGDTDAARSSYQQAIEMYEKWGAQGKVDHIVIQMQKRKLK